MNEPKYNAIIEKVLPQSIATELELREGDRLLSINGKPLRDVIDYRFLIADESLKLEIERIHPNGEEENFICEVEKDLTEDLGLEFTEELFDRMQTCSNKCLFCFVKQLPKGMRKSLYVMDDDYRLSFLHWNYITLTNVDEEEMQRIIRMRLSPLYISVHATDPMVREKLIGSPRAGLILDQLRQLAAAGIEIQAQVVLCPGINDGSILDKTIQDLSDPQYGVKSLAVVPVGLSQFRKDLYELRTFTPQESRDAIKQIHSWQRKLYKQIKTRFVFAADEFYLNAGMAVPAKTRYENFPQLGDGVGMVREFLTELSSLKWQIHLKGADYFFKNPRYSSVLLLTGVSAASCIQKMADVLNLNSEVSFQVLPIRNKYFGETINVTGLLTGKDIREQLHGEDLSQIEAIVVPDICLRDHVFLDDFPLQKMQDEFHKPFLEIPSHVKGLLNAIFE